MQRGSGSFPRTHLLTCVVIGVFSIASAISAVPPAAEIFGALPVQTDPALSPDGHWLAWIDYKEPKPRVVMFDLEARKVQRILGVPEKVNLHQLVWHNNQTLLIVLSETTESKRATERSRDTFRVIAHDVSGGDGRMLPMNHVSKRNLRHIEVAPLANLVAARISKPYTVIMAAHGMGDPPQASCLVEVDARTGNASVIKVGNEYTVGWVVDHNGQPRAREDWDWLHGQYHVYAFSGASIREVLHSDEAEPPRVGGALAGRSALLLFATNGRSHVAAWALPLDGSPLELLADAPNADIANAYTDPDTGAVIEVREGGGGPVHQHWLEPNAKGRYEALARAFPDRGVELYGWTADWTKTLARVSSPTNPPLYYLTDFKTHRADIAAEEYPGLAGAALGEFKELTYKARDGTEILAYLTTPPGKQSSPVPLVVLPHNGPHDRDHPLFNWLVQFLATRGYAVLQPQFRGSTGFGIAFQEAGYRQWGGLMQDDLTDGVRAMAEQRIADPRRVCILGTGAYGGYAALAGAAFTPDLYACAVSMNGISDLPALMREAVPRYGDAISTSQAVWKKRIGGFHDPDLAARSPINAVKSIRAPILILYGGDVGVPVDQSQSMARALTAAEKSVTVTTLPGDAEWWVRTSTRVHVLQELEKFLGEHLQRN
jgi:dipeptidyl aminopeptidase/acylaminoacyl peptidase